MDQRIRSAKKKSNNQEKILHRAWSDMSRGSQRIEAQRFVTTLIARFGGPKQLADQWYQAFTRATDAKRLRAATSLIFLIKEFQECPEALDYQRLDNLEQEQERLARLIVAEQLLTNPGTVAAIASELGYRLSPATA